jgi:hypothetical protein
VLGENQTQDLTPAVPNFCFEFWSLGVIKQILKA